MSDEVLVQANNVSKKYCRTLKRSLWYGVQDVAGELIGRDSFSQLRPGEFWPVKDVSFALKRGECLGLIGPNGAGKSTLLKMLSGLIKPDRGSIRIRGRVGALIELGAGFNPILTGRENIYVNGSVLGFRKNEIDSKLDEIIDFAEIEEFIDSPVQNYSSGMKVRLGFAIASMMNPDIFIIDEVLAVGDIGFRAKCYNRVAEIMERAAVILVTHSIPHVDRYCSRILLMNRGETVCDTSSSGISKGSAIQTYYNLYEKERGSSNDKPGNSLVQFRTLDFTDTPCSQIDHGSDLKLEIVAKLEPTIDAAKIHVSFLNREMQVVAICQSGVLTCESGELSASVVIAPILLNPADYKISVIVYDKKMQKHLLWHNACWDIKVTGHLINYGGAAICFDGKWINSIQESEAP